MNFKINLNVNLYQMQVNAHHLDKNNGLLTSHQNTCNFVPKLSYFNVVCSGLFNLYLFIVLLISLSALRFSFYTQFFEYVFRNISLDW